jgi:hypothetical protein
MVAMLVNSRWQTGAANRRRLHHPAFDASVMLTNRIVWFSNVDGKPATSLREDHSLLRHVPNAASLHGPCRESNRNRGRSDSLGGQGR